MKQFVVARLTAWGLSQRGRGQSPRLGSGQREVQLGPAAPGARSPFPPGAAAAHLARGRRRGPKTNLCFIYETLSTPRLGAGRDQRKACPCSPRGHLKTLQPHGKLRTRTHTQAHTGQRGSGVTRGARGGESHLPRTSSGPRAVRCRPLRGTQKRHSAEHHGALPAGVFPLKLIFSSFKPPLFFFFF